MPYTRKLTNKAGQVFYEISVSRGRGRSRLTQRWYPPEGWSQKAIDRELLAVAADFERRCDAGELMSRQEQRDKAAREAAEAARILTLRQYGERVFMPAKAVSFSENARSGYQRELDRHIYPALGDIKLPEITPSQLASLLLDIQAQGKAHATVIKCYTVLSSLFKMAYMGDMIDRNPMDKVERPKPRKDEKKPGEVEAYTAPELRYILNCLDDEPLKWRAFVRLLADTGMRRGECCALQWRDIDFKANTLTVSGNLCYTPEKGVYLDTPKNGRERALDVDPAIISMLRELREQQAASCISRFVFTQENSPEPMHPQSPTRYLKKFSQRYDIPGLHPHKLRHSFASIAITNGADIASVSEKLGHSDKAITLRMYTHADQESIKRASQIYRDAVKNA